MTTPDKSKSPAADHASPQGPQIPGDITSKNFSFVQAIIERTLVGQPQSIQAVVLFLFVFLFFYMVIFTMQGSILLKTEVAVELPKEQLNILKAAGKIPRAQQTAYGRPDSGYQIVYSDRYYGLNSNAEVFIGISLPRYVWILGARSLDVKILAPGGVAFPHSIDLKGTELDTISFQAPSSEQQLGASTPAWDEGGHVASRSFEFIASAQAAPTAGARLFVQSLTVPPSSIGGNVSASLVSGATALPLLALTPDLKSTTNASLLVKPGASVVQNFQTFFLLPDGQVPSKSAIKIQSDTLFGKGYSETFDIAGDLKLGTPVPLRGGSGGSLVVQLAYPTDVVFFERSDTASITEKLSMRVSAAGFVPRQSLGAVKLPGLYNVVYSGEDVPYEAVQKALAAIKNDMQIRSIQFKRRLSNGLQSQIQVGSSVKFSCLAPIDETVMAKLFSANSEPDFSKLVADFKSDPC